jgi:hypothetical protein
MLTIKCMTEHEVCEDWSGDGGWDERRQRGKWPCIRVGRDVADERISRLYLHISCNPFLTCLYITIPINGIMAITVGLIEKISCFHCLPLPMLLCEHAL